MLTERIVKRGADVVGIDASQAMVEAAQERGINARLMDAYQMPFDQEFDAVFSNATLHWLLDPQAVLASIKRALKPGDVLLQSLADMATWRRSAPR